MLVFWKLLPEIYSASPLYDSDGLNSCFTFPKERYKNLNGSMHFFNAIKEKFKHKKKTLL